MKLAVEKNSELNKLSQHFEKIETLAMKMGVEVEDLIQEYKNNNTAKLSSFKRSILAISRKRQELFRKTESNIPSVPSVIAINRNTSSEG